MSNGLEHKLFHFEATPRPENWEAINEALENEAQFQGHRLYNFQQIPPADLWHKIELALDNPDTVPSNPRISTSRNLFKYAAVAAILVLVATVITFVINTNDNRSEMARTQNALVVPAAKEPDTNQLTTQPKEITPSDTNLATEKEPARKPRIVNDKAKSSQPIAAAKTASARYLTMADDEGKKIRLSKKAYTVFNCAENHAARNNERCKENIQSMQKKMAASLVSPTGDFAGLMDMIKSLEENL